MNNRPTQYKDPFGALPRTSEKALRVVDMRVLKWPSSWIIKSIFGYPINNSETILEHTHGEGSSMMLA